MVTTQVLAIMVFGIISPYPTVPDVMII